MKYNYTLTFSSFFLNNQKVGKTLLKSNSYEKIKFQEKIYKTPSFKN